MCVWSVKAASAPFQTARDESNWVSSECHIAEHRVVDLTPHGSGWLYAQTRWNCCFSLPYSWFCPFGIVRITTRGLMVFIFSILCLFWMGGNQLLANQPVSQSVSHLHVCICSTSASSSKAIHIWEKQTKKRPFLYFHCLWDWDSSGPWEVLCARARARACVSVSLWVHCSRLVGGFGSNTEVRQTSDNNATEAKCWRGERKKKIPHRLCLVGLVGISSLHVFYPQKKKQRLIEMRELRGVFYISSLYSLEILVCSVCVRCSGPYSWSHRLCENQPIIILRIFARKTTIQLWYESRLYFI